MKKKHYRLSKRKLLIVLMLFILLFSIAKIEKVFASSESFVLSNVAIIKKSETAIVNSISYEKNKIKNDITFHKVGDSVTYKITISNNESEDYTIKTITDDNENEYITYEYNSYEGDLLKSKEEKTFEITSKYDKELMDIKKRNQDFSVNFTFVLEDENGNIIEKGASINTASSDTTVNSLGVNDLSDNSNVIVAQSTNPKTSDDIVIYSATSVLSVIILIILLRKNVVEKSTKRNRSKGKHYQKYSSKGFKAFGLIFALAIILPTISKASGISFDEIFNNSIKLMDKLIVSYEIDGEVKELIVKYNDVIEKIEVNEKDGYEFNGWMKEDGTTFDFDMPITDDVKIIADIKPITYQITYQLNGGKVKGNPEVYTIEDEITLKNPKKQGYTFSGWTGSNGDSLQTRVTIEKGSKGDKTYNANYSPNTNTKYTVIHKTMDLDGEHYSVRDVEELEGATDTTVKPQTKVYEQFISPTEEELIIKGDGTSTLEYKYTRNKYKLTLVDEEDIETSTGTGEYYYGTDITLKAKDKIGYTFSKWSNDETDKEISFTITEPVKIEPIYSINSYTVSFDSKGGSSVDTIIKNYNEEIGRLPIPSKSEQVFVGWYADEEYTTSVDEATKVIENATFYAKWRNLNNYTISFNANSGDVDTNSIIVREGNTVSNLPTPTKTDYIFEGWFTDLTYANEVTENTIPTEDTTCYAKWRYKFKTVYSLDGPVTFNGKDQNITGDAVPELHDKNYIDTGVKLFNEENYLKDFEIGFEIVEYDSDGQENQATFVNEKYENSSVGYPGFVFRRNYGSKQFEFTSRAGSAWPSARWNTTAVQKVKIYRKNNILYYSINDKEMVQFQDLSAITSYFETPVTFGASLQSNGSPFRFLKGTLKNLYIKLEE